MSKYRLAARLFQSAAVVSILAGCATTEVSVQTEEVRRRAEELTKVAARPMAAADVSPVKVNSDVYVGASVHRNDHGQPLPSKWDRAKVNIGKATLVTFQDVASIINEVTKIPVVTIGAPRVGPTGQPVQQAPAAAPAQQGGQGSAAGQPGNGTPRGMAVGPLPPGFDSAAAAAALLANGQPGAANQGAAQNAMQASGLPDAVAGDLNVPGKMRLAYSGSLVGFLNLVATNFNVGWEYRDERIVFEKTIARTFDIPTLPIITEMAFSMSSGSSQTASGGQSGGASNSGTGDQQANTKTAYKIAEDIKSALAAIVADGTYQYSQSTGQVTVIASPQTVTRVADYVRDLNATLSKQVALNVKVYSLTLSDTDTYQSNLDGLWQKSGQYGLSFGNGGTISPATGIPVPSTSATTSQAGSVGWAILNSKSPFAGTKGIFQALASRGDVSVVTSASLIAMNGVPAPLQVANTRGYAAQVSVTQSTGGTGAAAPTASITPGSITTGFNLHLLPKIRNDGSILLQYGMNISELVGADNGFDTFSSNGSSIQLPNVNQRNFIQEAILPNSSTLVLTGFEQVQSSATKNGPFNSSLFALGGSNSSALSRQILVITISPTVLDASVAANPPRQ